MQLKNIVLLVIIITHLEVFCIKNSNIENKTNLFALCDRKFGGIDKLYLSDYPDFHLPDIEKYDKRGLELFHNLIMHQRVPFIVCGDFDGNGINDIAAILLKKNKKGILIVFHQIEDMRFKMFTLDDNFDFNYDFFIIKKEIGSTIEGWSDPAVPESVGSVTLETDGIEFGQFESWSVLYFWRNDNYNKLVTSD